MFENFALQEVQNQFQLVAGDSGRTQIFTAAHGAGQKIMKRYNVLPENIMHDWLEKQK
jgi:hypothetical protein